MRLNALLLVAILSISLSISCGPDCDDDGITFCPLPETGERYFSGYKEGSYWIYRSKDSTRKDSVYVTDYESKLLTDDFELCIEYTNREMKLVADNLAEEPINIIYNNEVACDESRFYIDASELNLLVFSNTRSDSLYVTEYLSDSYLFTYLNDLKLAYNNVSYQDVVRVEFSDFPSILWFAPEVGLVQYTAHTGETFSLIKFHKQ